MWKLREFWIFNFETIILNLEKVFSNLEPEGQGGGIIMGVTRLLLLGPFYSIQTNFMYFFAHDCISYYNPPSEMVSSHSALLCGKLPERSKICTIFMVFFVFDISASVFPGFKPFRTYTNITN